MFDGVSMAVKCIRYRMLKCEGTGVEGTKYVKQLSLVANPFHGTHIERSVLEQISGQWSIPSIKICRKESLSVPCINRI
jgi:hypothetical protein